MDTKQVIDVMELKKDHDKLFGVGHSFGATSMYVNRERGRQQHPVPRCSCMF